MILIFLTFIFGRCVVHDENLGIVGGGMRGGGMGGGRSIGVSGKGSTGSGARGTKTSGLTATKISKPNGGYANNFYIFVYPNYPLHSHVYQSGTDPNRNCGINRLTVKYR